MAITEESSDRCFEKNRQGNLGKLSRKYRYGVLFSEFVERKIKSISDAFYGLLHWSFSKLFVTKD